MEIRTSKSQSFFVKKRARIRSDFQPAVEIRNRNRKSRAMSVHSDRFWFLVVSGLWVLQRVSRVSSICGIAWLSLAVAVSPERPWIWSRPYGGLKKTHTPSREKITKIIRPEYSYVILGGRLRQNYVITKKLVPQELFCVIGGCKDLRLFHVELREIYVTPEKIILREFFCVIDYVRVSQSPRK